MPQNLLVTYSLSPLLSAANNDYWSMVRILSTVEMRIVNGYHWHSSVKIFSSSSMVSSIFPLRLDAKGAPLAVQELRAAMIGILFLRWHMHSAVSSRLFCFFEFKLCLNRSLLLPLLSLCCAPPH